MEVYREVNPDRGRLRVIELSKEFLYS